LQRNQHDTQRRNDLDRVGAQVSSYMANNQGRVPFTDPSDDENAAAECNGENAVPVANGARRVAFRMKLEGAGAGGRNISTKM
jgi:hypothetical protein